MNENIFDKLDFGPFRALLDDDDITDISYDNGGQIWIRSLTQGSMRVEVGGATPEFVEKLAFQCSNVMGTTFNNAKPFLDAESAELRMNFVHQSIATNGIALVIRKTPAKIRLEKDKLIEEDYFTPAIHDFLIKCVEGHCNIMVAGETGSGKTEFVKYLASHTKTNEKIITIEDTLELHLDKIYPQRDIVAMKTNNVASYSEVLVTCMRQNPKWILLSEVRSAEAVSAVRNSISSGHNILSTIHADKASAIPYRLYSLMETDLDVNQFLNTIYRYIQLGVHIKAFYSKEYGQFHREVDEVCEFYVDDNNVPQSRVIYRKQLGKMMMCKPSDHLVQYIENQNIDVRDIIKDLPDELPIVEVTDDSFSNDNIDGTQDNVATVPEVENKDLDNVLNGNASSEEAVLTNNNEESNLNTVAPLTAEVVDAVPDVGNVYDALSPEVVAVCDTNQAPIAQVASLGSDNVNNSPSVVAQPEVVSVSEQTPVQTVSPDVASIQPVSTDSEPQIVGTPQVMEQPQIQQVTEVQTQPVITNNVPSPNQPVVIQAQNVNPAPGIPVLNSVPVGVEG